ncbi:MAG: NAD(P)H-dependent glycerol-3-phosphate dehydrogenase [Bacteroidales bacterium]
MEFPGRVAVFGSGSWATALVKILLNNLRHVNWYIRKQETIDFIREHHHNPSYISSITFDISRIDFFTDPAEAIRQSDLLIFAIPSAFLKDTLEPAQADLTGKFIVSAIKGIVPEDNLTIAEYFNRHFNVPFNSIGVITGPSHAEEIAMEKLTYLTIASKSQQRADALAALIGCWYVKTITTHDIYGVEYAGVLKNIFAIAAGISHGLGYGDNFQAVLVSNAIQEGKRFLDKTYKSKRKLYSSAYLGDLLVTTYSQFSRNRTFGAMLGKGYPVKAAQMEMSMIAEGYYSSKCIHELNETFGVKMPIADTVYSILYEKETPHTAIKLLTEKLK